MVEVWSRNIRRNLELVASNRGPLLVLVAAGDAISVNHWKEHLQRTAPDTFRADRLTTIKAVLENSPKGNFLGTLNAWGERQSTPDPQQAGLPPVSLISMSFGMGKRLSPFTQTLGNRKSAFVTPLKGPSSNRHLCTADISNLYSNLWLEHLEKNGFRGVIVKWGDEAVIPGLDWNGEIDYSRVDAVRFVWETPATKELARDKDWVIIDPRSRLVHYQLPRQAEASLSERLRAFESRGYHPAVNLGSLAVSYRFLEVAVEIFGDDLRCKERAVDWDPYVWTALCCRNRSDWIQEAEKEDQAGISGIRTLEARYPDFYPKVNRVRTALEEQTGRPLSIAALDFGRPLWVDLGLHGALQRSLGELPLQTDWAQGIRELFGVPHERDLRGNIIVDSELPPGLEIRNSVVIDSKITDSSSVLEGAVVVGCKFRKALLPLGGVALFSAADEVEFRGARAICFRSVTRKILLEAGGRHSTLFLREGPRDLLSNERVVQYDHSTYSEPIFGNALSFQEAGDLAAKMAGHEVDRQWAEAWNSWPV